MEEGAGAVPTYPCCKFRGSLVALDSTNGNVIWRTYTIAEEAHATTKNRKGTQLWGPSGVALWNSPTLDLKRRAIYVGTGNNYSNPPTDLSDAVVAFDMDSGKIRWVRQLTPRDAWNTACPKRAPDSSNCPDEDAPDFDFAASPILVDMKNGSQLLLAGQKSGMVYALDPEQAGKLVWEQRVGKGGTAGGVQWGPAVDAEKAYVAISDAARVGNTAEWDPNSGGGISALEVGSGKKVWSTPSPGCGNRRPCTPAQSAAVTAIPGVVFSGAVDGHLRAYSTEDGRILWDYDTAREYTTVNGVQAKGGSIDNGGVSIVDGMVFTNSGYSRAMPGNVLLGFSVD
jgi:polyvinyl alcohol dehydrogenase (cytochrome)